MPAITMHTAIGAGVYLALSILLGVLGRRRKMGGWGYFFGSIALTPVIGLLLLLASDPRRADD